MKNEIHEEEIIKVKLVLADDFLAWHKGLEVKLVQAGINKKDIDTFVNAAINEKISREAIEKWKKKKGQLPLAIYLGKRRIKTFASLARMRNNQETRAGAL